ncbi:MAG: 50S ribosomal protein L24 [Candidatus Aenigmarchaeota archaeon]|nr:50S ribosomal protein L24 [Candidatus Aenigmarchaeota archaeon]
MRDYMRQPKSSKSRKQRKFLYTAPLHLRRKILASHLSKELREKFKRRALPLRKGDEIQIMRGKFKDRRGKVARVNYKKYRVYIEGVTRKRTVGTEAQVGLHPSKVKIINLNLDDKKRQKILERKGIKLEVTTSAPVEK